MQVIPIGFIILLFISATGPQWLVYNKIWGQWLQACVKIYTALSFHHKLSDQFTFLRSSINLFYVSQLRNQSSAVSVGQASSSSQYRGIRHSSTSDQITFVRSSINILHISQEISLQRYPWGRQVRHCSIKALAFHHLVINSPSGGHNKHIISQREISRQKYIHGADRVSSIFNKLVRISETPS